MECWNNFARRVWKGLVSLAGEAIAERSLVRGVDFEGKYLRRILLLLVLFSPMDDLHIRVVGTWSPTIYLRSSTPSVSSAVRSKVDNSALEICLV